MTRGPIHRFLELAERELEASDVRAEMGGRDPHDDRLVWCVVPGGWRIVAVFDEKPANADELSKRLQQLANTFFETTSSLGEARPRPTREPAARRLDDELDTLAERVGAVHAVVLDHRSPVIWGTSEPRRSDEDVDTALRTARLHAEAEAAGADIVPLFELEPEQAKAALLDSGLDQERAKHLSRELERLRALSQRRGQAAWRRHLLTTRAIAQARAAAEREEHTGHFHLTVRDDDFGFIARGFATIYILVVVFDQTFSELQAEGAVLHALPFIEHLVVALPPSDPPPSPRGQVKKLRPV